MEKKRRTPLVRVWLLGPFQVEARRDDGTWETIHTWDRGYARPLLRRLLCSPGRRVERNTILDDLWPDPASPDSIERYLNDAAYQLRKLLREPTLLKTGDNASTYQLAGQSLLWVDADACEDLLKEAERVGRTSAAVLPLLEQARAYGERGDFLEGNGGIWSHGRRGTIERVCYRCELWLAEAYERQGMPGQAENVLSQLLERDSLDEDVLCRLMQVQYRQGMIHQALRVYDRVRDRFLAEGLKPSGGIQTLVAQIQQDRHSPAVIPGHAVDPSISSEFVNQSTATTKPPTSTEVTGDASSLFSASRFVQGLLLSPLPPITLQISDSGRTDWQAWFSLKTGHLTTLIDHGQDFISSSDQLQLLIDQEFIVLDTMKPEGEDNSYTLSRRQMLLTLAHLPLALSPSIHTGIRSTVMVEKLLMRCAGSLAACWHLLKGNELSLVEQIVSSYVLSLGTLAQQPSQYQATAARLASQAYRLYGIVALHRNNLAAREHYCQQALYFSEITQDPRLQVSAHISLASTFFYNKNPSRAMRTYQKALIYEDHISPLQRSRLHAELAVVYAQQKLEQEALHALHLAQNLYPHHPENDPSYLYAEFSPASLVLEEGLTHLALAEHFPGRPHRLQAWKSFARIDELVVRTAVPERIFFEITNQRAATAVLLKELELVRIYIEQGLEGAQRLNSKQRLQEISTVYQQALVVWPDEKRLEDLQEHFHASNH